MQTTQKAQQEYDKMVKKASPNSPMPESVCFWRADLRRRPTPAESFSGPQFYGERSRALRFHHADWDFGSADGPGAV